MYMSVRRARREAGDWRTYDDPGVPCGEVDRGLEGLAADVVPVAASSVGQRRRGRVAEGAWTYMLRGPSRSSTSRVFVVL